MRKIIRKFFIILVLINFQTSLIAAEKATKPLSPGWSFKGFFGKFDRGSLQRGYQVYNEVCAACHSMKYLSYRNLSEPEDHSLKKRQSHSF